MGIRLLPNGICLRLLLPYSFTGVGGLCTGAGLAATGWPGAGEAGASPNDTRLGLTGDIGDAAGFGDARCGIGDTGMRGDAELTLVGPGDGA